MKANGSAYVAVVFAVLVAYFGYQWWFNPARAIKRRLGEVAAALSVPAEDDSTARIARLARLRRYLADDVQVRVAGSAPAAASRDAVLAVVEAMRPAGGVDVQFVDVQINVDSDVAGRAFLTVELITPDQQSGQPTIDARPARIALGRRDGEWVITSAESQENPARP